MAKDTPNTLNAVINLVTASLVIALIWVLIGTGGGIALSLSSLPTPFWIFIILIILYWLIGRR